jgi:hypothetical protein
LTESSYTLEFDGSAHEVPDGVSLGAVSVSSAVDLLMSFDAADRFSFAELMMDQDRIHILAASDGRYKLIRDRQGRAEFFDLERDPGELVDVSEQFPEVRDRLAASLDAYLAQEGDATSDDSKPGLDDRLRQQLRALGHVP